VPESIGKWVRRHYIVETQKGMCRAYGADETLRSAWPEGGFFPPDLYAEWYEDEVRKRV